MVRQWAVATVRFLASLKLAIVLLVLLAIVLAAATFLEAAKGRDYARWYVYDARWFVTTMGLLGANVLAAALIRFPWKKRQTAFLVTHAGLLVLLAGSIQTYRSGIDGQLPLEEGAASDRIVLHDYSRFQVSWPGRPDREDRRPAAFVFRPGPTDWPDGKSLDFGEISGVNLKVTKFLAHACRNQNWDADPVGEGPAALKFAMAGPEEAAGAEHWLVASQFGAEAAVGSARLAFYRAAADSLVDDFLAPPPGPLDSLGVLAIHYEGSVKRIPLSENVGKTISLAKDGAAVKVVKYIPNARPDANGGFASNGDEPKNPLVEVEVRLPGKKEPIRQIAFARYPLMSFDGVRGRDCPVRFWYHHPAMKAESGVEFLAMPNGKLYCRVGIGGKHESRGLVRAGDSVPTWGNSSVSIIQFLAHARQEVSFRPRATTEGWSAARGASPEAPAAAEVEVTAGGRTQRLWLAHDDQSQLPEHIQTPEGPLLLSFGYDELPLGFAVRLSKCTRGMNPGGMGDASFASSVEVADPGCEDRQQQEISMNQPMVHGKFTFYQSGLLPGGKGSVLTVACDPGRFLKYLGSLMVCLGSAVMFCTRARVFSRTVLVRPKNDSTISTLGKAA